MGRRTVANAAKWSLLEKWSSRAVLFLVFVLLGRLVSPTVFGLVAVATVVTTLLQVFMDAGVTEAIIRRAELTDDVIDTAFWLSTAMGLVLLGMGELLSQPLADLYGQPKLAPVIMVMSLGVLIQSLGAVQDALLQRSMKFKQLAARRVLAAVAGAVAGISWAIASPSVWALVAQYLTLTLCGTIVLWTVGPYRPHLRFNPAVAHSLLGFGLQVLGIRFLTYLTDQGDNFIVGLQLGATELGYYVVAFRIYATVNDVITIALTQVALPVFSRLRETPSKMVDALFAATRASVAVVVPFMLGTAAVADHLIPFLFGHQWGPSVRVMQILSLVGLLNSVTFFDRSILIAVGQVRRELWITLTAGAGNIVAYWIGSHWGIDGVAIALVCRAYLFWPIRLWALHSCIGVPILRYLRQWLVPVIAGGAMVAVIRLVLIAPIGPFQLPASLVAGGLFYYAVLSQFAPRYRDEVVALLRMALRPAKAQPSI